ncbi:hypothetical protein JCM1840_006802 [Sporobolomyces johnsonii]
MATTTTSLASGSNLVQKPRSPPSTEPPPTLDVGCPAALDDTTSISTPRKSRRERIEHAVQTKDLEELRRMSSETGGFENSELRRLVWPALLGVDRKGKKRATNGQSPEDFPDSLPARDDERQVRLDIIRSLINYPTGISDDEREVLRDRLEKAILTVLRRYPALQYFQGYHDIVSIFLLTLEDDDLVVATTEQMSLHRIRDSMGSGLEPTLGYLKLVHRIVQKVDPQLYDIINQAASMPFFALSWALTLFSHDLYSVAVIARLFDFLLAHNPAMISYLVVAILQMKKDDLLAALAAEDNDPATVHSVLSQLPNIVLSAPPVPPSPPSTPPPAYASEAETEDLMSSSASVSTSSVFSNSPADLSESLISHSEASSPLSTLRQRHPRRSSFSSFDDDIQALGDSMLSDPDIDGPAFSPFPAPRTPSRTPSPPSTPSPTFARAAFESPQKQKTQRTVLADDLIRSALSLSRAFPLVSSSSHHDDDDDDDDDEVRSIHADTVLGPNSCVFTWVESAAGLLSDDEAERICRDGMGIVKLEALLPDPDPEQDEDEEEADEDAEEEEEEEADDFEFVDVDVPGGPRSTETRRGRSRRGRSSLRRRGPGVGAGGRLNLGPQGWLVVGGVAVATAAVALSVYGGYGYGGLGTGGVGLGTGGGGGGGGGHTAPGGGAATR